MAGPINGGRRDQFLRFGRADDVLVAGGGYGVPVALEGQFVGGVAVDRACLARSVAADERDLEICEIEGVVPQDAVRVRCVSQAVLVVVLGVAARICCALGILGQRRVVQGFGEGAGVGQGARTRTRCGPCDLHLGLDGAISGEAGRHRGDEVDRHVDDVVVVEEAHRDGVGRAGVVLEQVEGDLLQTGTVQCALQADRVLSAAGGQQQLLARRHLQSADRQALTVVVVVDLQGGRRLDSEPVGAGGDHLALVVLFRPGSDDLDPVRAGAALEVLLVAGGEEAGGGAVEDVVADAADEGVRAFAAVEVVVSVTAVQDIGRAAAGEVVVAAVANKGGHAGTAVG